MRTKVKQATAAKPQRVQRPSSKIKLIRRVIRRVDTQEYFASDGWTRDAQEALPFADSLEATQAVVEYGLSGVEVVLRMSGANSDLFCTWIR